MIDFITADPYDIVLHPDPVLKQVCTPVEHVNDDIRTQIDRMFKTMYMGVGVGIAASQVGILNRIFVMDVEQTGTRHDDAGHDLGHASDKNSSQGCGDSSCRDSNCGSGAANTNKNSNAQNISGPATGNPIALINPEIVKVSDNLVPYDEGCLSLPQQYAEIMRPETITVRYLDQHGKQKEITDATGLLSVCIQHEIDHLDGILFTDHLSSLRRNTLIRKLKKFKREEGITNNRLVL